MKAWFKVLDDKYDDLEKSGWIIWIFIGIVAFAGYLALKIIF